MINNMFVYDGLAEYCWNDTVWNLKFDESVPLCISRIYQYIQAHDRFVWAKQVVLDKWFPLIAVGSPDANLRKPLGAKLQELTGECNI